MSFSVENVCGLLIGSKLLAADEVKSIYQRWQAEAGDAAGDLAHFTRWLVSRQYVTEYQAALVAKGYNDGFFIQNYKILERLGKGRSAGVYKAVHQLGQIVAIKVLPPSQAKDSRKLARFQREARLAVRLKHPHVVRSFQIGDYKDLHYLVMEYLEGETLDAVLERRRQLPASEAVRLMHQALGGLQHIHEQGLVHRDLKPANLMLTPAPPRNEPTTTLHSTLKILDIGLGRVPSERGNGDQGLTDEGVLLGTPDYLAPEQARDPRHTDIRADIYSLGCVFYQMLTGQTPFPDTNVLSQMVRHATETPKPLRELAPGAPDGLQQVVSSMLAKDQVQRFATPDAAARALQPFLGGATPVKPPEDGPHLKKYLTWLEKNASPKEQPTRATDPVVAPPVKPAPAPTTAAIPVAPPPPPPSPKTDFDAEPMPALPPQGGMFPATNRDWYFLGLGAGGVILAGLVGFVLALVLRGW
jgi:serine/threonine protein kinase